MAINNTNSNFVNIQSLPQTQYALDTDLVLLQTNNGTQTITFDNFNVVKKDLEGNVSVQGLLSGRNVVVNSIGTTNLSASQYWVNNSRGTSRGGFFYSNIFTIANGIVTSADFRTGSPEYVSLVSLVRTISTIQNGAFKTVIEQNGTLTIQGGTSASNTVSISLPADVGGSIKPWHFTLVPNIVVTNFDSGAAVFENSVNMLGVALKAFEVAPGASTGTLRVKVFSPTVLTYDQDISFRLLYFAN